MTMSRRHAQKGLALSLSRHINEKKNKLTNNQLLVEPYTIRTRWLGNVDKVCPHTIVDWFLIFIFCPTLYNKPNRREMSHIIFNLLNSQAFDLLFFIIPYYLLLTAISTFVSRVYSVLCNTFPYFFLCWLWYISYVTEPARASWEALSVVLIGRRRGGSILADDTRWKKKEARGTDWKW